LDGSNFVRVAAASAAVLVLIVAPVVAADPATPATITFRGTGTPPLVCGSQPDITSLHLTRGQTIILTNSTGVAASIDVGGKTPRTVAPSSGISVKLAVGEHALRMVPACLLVGEVGQALVVVTPGPVVVEPTTVEPSAGGASSGPPAGEPVPTAGPMTPGSAVGPTSSHLAPSADPDPTGECDPEVATVAADQPPDQRGVRLLAVIAAICVLGVTAGIIRAIVTHRTRVSLRTISSK
jgi:hypothetical protein